MDAAQYRTASGSDRMLLLHPKRTAINDELSLGSSRYCSWFCNDGVGLISNGVMDAFVEKSMRQKRALYPKEISHRFARISTDQHRSEQEVKELVSISAVLFGAILTIRENLWLIPDSRSFSFLIQFCSVMGP